MKALLRRLRRCRSGQGLVEYALLIMLVGVALVAALRLLGNNTGNLFGRSSNALAGVTGGTTGGGTTGGNNGNNNNGNNGNNNNGNNNNGNNGNNNNGNNNGNNGNNNNGFFNGGFFDNR